MTTPWDALASGLTRLTDRVDALPSVREATVVSGGAVRFDTDEVDTQVHGWLISGAANGARVLTLKLRHYVWVLGSKGGSSGFNSAADRDAVYPNPRTGNTVYRQDRQWWETYYDTSLVHVAGWYPVSGRLPEIRITKNAGLVSFGGPAWTPVRDNWNWNAPTLINTTDFMSWDTGCIRIQTIGNYSFEYALDLNLVGSGAIFAISEFSSAHAFADDRAVASQTFPPVSGRTSCIVRKEKVTGVDRYVQGNLFASTAGSLDGATRSTTSFIMAKYIGPPFK